MSKTELKFSWQEIYRIFTNKFGYILDEDRKNITTFVLTNIQICETFTESLLGNIYIEMSPRKKELIFLLKECLITGRDRLTRTGFAKCNGGNDAEASDLLNKYSEMKFYIPFDLSAIPDERLNEQFMSPLMKFKEKLNRCDN